MRKVLRHRPGNPYSRVNRKLVTLVTHRNSKYQPNNKWLNSKHHLNRELLRLKLTHDMQVSLKLRFRSSKIYLLFKNLLPKPSYLLKDQFTFQSNHPLKNAMHLRPPMLYLNLIVLIEPHRTSWHLKSCSLALSQVKWVWNKCHWWSQVLVSMCPILIQVASV